MDTPKFEQLPVGLHYGISRAQYDADPGVNQSKLKLFKSSGTPYHFKHELENPKDASHFRIGNALDAMICSPEDFHKKFTVWTGDRKQGAAWDKFEAVAESEGKTVLGKKEAAQVEGMIAGLKRKPSIWNTMQGCQKQVMVVANHPLGFRMKCLLDFVEDIDAEFIFDLKSSGFSAAPKSWNDQSYKRGYDVQLAYYMKACQLAGMKNLKYFGFFVVESKAPHEAAGHTEDLGGALYNKGESSYLSVLPEYLKCLNSNSYPGLPEEWFRMKYEPYQLNEKERVYEAFD